MTEKETEMKANKPLLQDYHNQELVSKLIAATPSYLYAPPTGPHTFFFSEMLRSFVQKRKIEEMNPIKAKQMAKKIRKPNMYNPQMENDWKRQKTNSPPPQKPKTPELIREEQLDLRKSFSNENEDPKPNSPLSDDNSEAPINVDKDDESPAPPTTITATSNTPTSNTSTAALPPPLLPPWYHPPFYDPLHFFIDLRVSGHIYDRKKDYLHQALKSNNILLDSNTWNPSIIGKNRPGSAFKVPNSLQDSSNYNAINLITNNNQNSIIAQDKSPLNFDYYDSKENKDKIPNNTNYVMSNLPNIYKKLYTKPDEEGVDIEHQDDRDSNNDKNSDEDVEVIFDLDVKLEQKK